MAILEYRAPALAAKCIHSHFVSGRDRAVVLDVACGTGLVAKQVHFLDKHREELCMLTAVILLLQTNMNIFALQLKTQGFKNFVGIDGSKEMLEKAKDSGLYQDLRLCLMGEEPLPVQTGCRCSPIAFTVPGGLVGKESNPL